MRPRIAAALAFSGAILSGVQAIQTVSRAGKYLYTADGNRFYIKGIAYQEQGPYFPYPLTVYHLNFFSRPSRC